MGSVHQNKSLLWSHLISALSEFVPFPGFIHPTPTHANDFQVSISPALISHASHCLQGISFLKSCSHLNMAQAEVISSPLSQPLFPVSPFLSEEVPFAKTLLYSPLQPHWLYDWESPKITTRQPDILHNYFIPLGLEDLSF